MGHGSDSVGQAHRWTGVEGWGVPGKSQASAIIGIDPWSKGSSNTSDIRMADDEQIKRFARDFPGGAVLKDFTDIETQLRVLVVRGPLSFCAYLGVPNGHPLSGMEDLQLAHGHNFQQHGSAETIWPEGWYWWGWDYAGSGSQISLADAENLRLPPELLEIFEKGIARATSFDGRSVKNWTVDEVIEDVFDVLVDLKQKMQVAQAASSRVLPPRPRK